METQKNRMRSFAAWKSWEKPQAGLPLKLATFFHLYHFATCGGCATSWPTTMGQWTWIRSGRQQRTICRASSKSSGTTFRSMRQPAVSAPGIEAEKTEFNRCPTHSVALAFDFLHPDPIPPSPTFFSRLLQYLQNNQNHG